jgi:ABC-type uncharacterized transport system involved in gliding motility auxiliary subunit
LTGLYFMKKSAGFWGILGAVLVLFGFIGGLLLGSFREPFLLIHLFVGGLLLVWWCLASGFKAVSDAQSIIRGRTARFGANAVLYTIVAVGLLVVANWFANRYDMRWDVSEQGAFSLSSQSERIVSGLEQNLRLVGFDLGENRQELNDLLRLYKLKNSSKVSTEIIDPRSKPHLVEKYGMKLGNVLYLSYGPEGKEAVSRVNELSEEVITNAVIKLTRGAAQKVYFLQGHGEPNLRGANPIDIKLFVEALEDEHLQVEELLLSTAGVIPDDAAAVLVIAPQNDLLPEERDLLVSYAEKGGRLLLFHDPRTTDDVTLIADRFSIKIGNNIVIDQVQQLLAAPVLGAEPVVRDYADHDITRDFDSNSITIFNIASTVSKGENAPAGVELTELLKTSPTSWAETNIEALFGEEPQAQQEPSDKGGPVPLAVAYERKIESTSGGDSADGIDTASRVVVFGDSDWIRNSGFRSFANRDLILNSVNWTVGMEGGISIRPRSIKESAAPIPKQTYLTILASSFLLPECILILGLAVWWRRRQFSIA